eukprot:3180965-Pyramimonas_sp.AAC.1
MNNKKKRPNKGKPILHSSTPISTSAAPGGARRPGGTEAAPGKAAVANARSQAVVANNAPGKAVEA